jgi:gas vesicle protein
MSNPDEIRAQIEATRAGLSQDVNELGDKVSPAKIADRQKAKLRDSVTSVKEHIMGAADDAKSSTTGAVASVKEHIMGAADDAKSSTGHALSSAGDAVSATPGKVVSQTKGNPMAAGLIAFGAGMLLSALIPASQKEAQAAAALKEQAQPLVHKATDAVKEVAGNLQEPAHDALDSVKSTATDAVGAVKEESASAAGDVKSQAQDAKDTVQQHASS